MEEIIEVEELTYEEVVNEICEEDIDERLLNDNLLLYHLKLSLH